MQFVTTSELRAIKFPHVKAVNTTSVSKWTCCRWHNKHNSTWRHQQYEQILWFTIVKSWLIKSLNSTLLTIVCFFFVRVFSSFTWWLQTEPSRRYGCGGWARSTGVPTTPWAPWTHNLLEERWFQLRWQRWTHHSKRLLSFKEQFTKIASFCHSHHHVRQLVH